MPWLFMELTWTPFTTDGKIQQSTIAAPRFMQNSLHHGVIWQYKVCQKKNVIFSSLKIWLSLNVLCNPTTQQALRGTTRELGYIMSFHVYKLLSRAVLYSMVVHTCAKVTCLTRDTLSALTTYIWTEQVTLAWLAPFQFQKPQFLGTECACHCCVHVKRLHIYGFGHQPELDFHKPSHFSKQRK